MSRRLGRYELLEQLGEGGMGAVWLARLTGAAGFEKLCIVKTVLPAIAKDAEFVSRFLHEGRVLTQLSHGNIAQVLDLNEADGTLFLALEYVAGVDLSRLHEQVRAAQELLPIDVAMAIVAQAAEGLGAAHRKAALDGSPLSIVHRDVSPHNVMVSYEGEVKVIDFGIAKSEARSRHTAQASVLGKLGYMAPEQASGENVDHRADQYALGIIAWELLSNQSFVRRGTLTEMVAAMANPKVQPLVPLRAEVPASLEAVVLKALSLKPEERFESTDAFAQALTRELLALGAPPTKPAIGQYVRSRCAQEFATTRALLTRVSTQRSPPPEAERPKVDLFAETTVRPKALADTLDLGALRSPGADPSRSPRAESRGAVSPAHEGVLDSARTEREDATLMPVGTLLEAPAITPLDRPAPGRVLAPAPMPISSPPLTTGELQAATRSKQPALIAGVGAVVLLLALAVFVTSRGGEEVRLAVDAGVQVVVQGPPPVEPPDAGAAPLAEVIVDAGLVAVAPPAPEDEQPTLRLAARRTSTSWVVSNGNRTSWTRCRMTLPGQRVAELGTVQKGVSREVFLRGFRVDPAARTLEQQARVDCAEGFGVVKAP